MTSAPFCSHRGLSARFSPFRISCRCKWTAPRGKSVFSMCKNAFVSTARMSSQMRNEFKRESPNQIGITLILFKNFQFIVLFFFFFWGLWALNQKQACPQVLGSTYPFSQEFIMQSSCSTNSQMSPDNPSPHVPFPAEQVNPSFSGVLYFFPFSHCSFGGRWWQMYQSRHKYPHLTSGNIKKPHIHHLTIHPTHACLFVSREHISQQNQGYVPFLRDNL